MKEDENNTTLERASQVGSFVKSFSELASKDFVESFKNAEFRREMSNSISGEIDRLVWAIESNSSMPETQRTALSEVLNSLNAQREAHWNKGLASVDKMIDWRSTVPTTETMRRVELGGRTAGALGTAITSWNIGMELADGNYLKAANMTSEEAA